MQLGNNHELLHYHAFKFTAIDINTPKTFLSIIQIQFSSIPFNLGVLRNDKYLAWDRDRTLCSFVCESHESDH